MNNSKKRRQAKERPSVGLNESSGPNRHERRTMIALARRSSRTQRS